MSKVTEFKSNKHLRRDQQNMRSLYALQMGDPSGRYRVATMDIENYAKEFESVNGCKIEYSGKDCVYSIKILEDEK